MMKTDVKKIDNIKREISIEVSGDSIKDKLSEAFKKIQESAKVPGFRPGHVPQDILEKNFSRQAHEFVLQELIPQFYQKAVKEQGLDVIDLPEISEVKLEGSSLSFKAKVEVAPQFKLKDYKGVKVNYKKIEVSPEEIKRHLDSLKESRKLDNLDDNFARSIGYPNLGELEKALERQIFIQKENAQRQDLESEIIEKLTKDLDFQIPQVMINRQLQDLVRQAKVNLAMKGLERSKVEEKESELTKELQPQARQQVKVYLVLAEIAKKENIALDDHMPQKVLEFLLKEADWQQAA